MSDYEDRLMMLIASDRRLPRSRDGSDWPRIKHFHQLPYEGKTKVVRTAHRIARDLSFKSTLTRAEYWSYDRAFQNLVAYIGDRPPKRFPACPHNRFDIDGVCPICGRRPLYWAKGRHSGGATSKDLVLESPDFNPYGVRDE